MGKMTFFKKGTSDGSDGGQHDGVPEHSQQPRPLHVVAELLPSRHLR